MKNDTELRDALTILEACDPETEAQSCIAAARRFAGTRRVIFDTRLAELMADAEPGERAALEQIRQAGPRALAREFLREAEGWKQGGGLRAARLSVIHDLQKRLH